MPNELDMDTYHQSEIEPGEHKVFNIAPTIHTFNERFQGEDQSFPSMLTPGFDPSKMPDWWVRQVTPKPFYSQYGSPEPIPNTSEDEPSVPLQPIPIHPSKGYLPTSESELKSYRPTFRDMLRGWLRGTSPSPERAQIVDQLLGHTEAGEQTGIHKLNIGDIIDMQPEEMIGTGVIGPRTLIGSKMFNEVIKELVKRGHSFNDIANFLETTRGSIAGRVKRMGIKSSEDERSTRSYYSPSQESLPGTKRFDESLSDWMKNQFKGGPVEPEIERITAAAVKHPETGKVYEGSHHFKAVENASKDYPATYDIPWEEGFVTNTGRYVDRKEAEQIAERANQLKTEAERYFKGREQTKFNKSLITEDLKDYK